MRAILYRSRLIFALICVLAFTAGALAAPLVVGTITVDQNTTKNDGTIGGSDFICHFDLNATFDTQTCCAKSDLHWIQLVTTSKKIPGNFPDPNRPFIDPRSGQNIGGGQTGNGTPFYDITVDKTADFGDNTKWRREGTGTFLGDGPQNLLSEKPFMFMAESLLICQKPTTMMMGILGGVKWGYNIAADSSVSVLPPMTLMETQDIRDRFNTALGLDFNGWTIADTGTLWDGQQ